MGWDGMGAMSGVALRVSLERRMILCWDEGVTVRARSRKLILRNTFPVPRRSSRRELPCRTVLRENVSPATFTFTFTGDFLVFPLTDVTSHYITLHYSSSFQTPRSTYRIPLYEQEQDLFPYLLGLISSCA